MGCGRLVTGICGDRMSANASGAPSVRITARTAGRGITCRTMLAGPGPTGGARMAWPGSAIKDTIAPKISEVFVVTARRVDIAPPRRRWPGVIAGTALLAAAGAAVAVVPRRRKDDRTCGPPWGAADAGTSPQTAQDGQPRADAGGTGRQRAVPRRSGEGQRAAITRQAASRVPAGVADYACAVRPYDRAQSVRVYSLVARCRWCGAVHPSEVMVPVRSSGGLLHLQPGQQPRVPQ